MKTKRLQNSYLPGIFSFVNSSANVPHSSLWPNVESKIGSGTAHIRNKGIRIQGLETEKKDRVFEIILKSVKTGNDYIKKKYRPPNKNICVSGSYIGGSKFLNSWRNKNCYMCLS